MISKNTMIRPKKKDITAADSAAGIVEIVLFLANVFHYMCISYISMISDPQNMLKNIAIRSAELVFK